ncbi:hypothetical protein CDAR_403591 [Caerostris darwini]|uniref:Uncharacterized protein n=1 Tax=Caerostris darwini TaxID=1538125 RepID=A0AAV4PVS4_9ARAC|nr:hypothetical protein CDAR_403591 [Caerostris darwini]
MHTHVKVSSEIEIASINIAHKFRESIFLLPQHIDQAGFDIQNVYWRPISILAMDWWKISCPSIIPFANIYQQSDRSTTREAEFAFVKFVLVVLRRRVIFY